MCCWAKASCVVAIIAFAAAGIGALAAQGDGAKGASMGAKPHAGFERMKKLAGDWEGTAGMGGEPHPANLSLRLTSGGNTLVETEFCGSEHEMMSVFYLDRGELVLTHFCHLANQPHMKAKSASDKEIVFEFAGGSNIDPKVDMHMHEARYQWIDEDHFISSWTLYEKGQAAGEAKMDMKRKKAATAK